MRAFVAVTLNDGVRTQLEMVTETLRRTGVRASWVKRDNLHVTLKFLGEVDDALLPEIQNQLDRAAKRLTGFEVSLDGFGFFPLRGRPRILYAATDQHRLFRQLVACVDEALEPFGFKRELNFVPHITLARIKSPRHLPRLKSELESQEANAAFTVSGITLFRSRLDPSGVRYDVLYQGYLKGFI